MGSCFSKRKRSDAAVTHNASPRPSFSLNCKATTPIAPVQNPCDEMVAVATIKNSAPLITSNRSSSLKKSKSKKAPCQQQQEQLQPLEKESPSVLKKNAVSDFDSQTNTRRDEKTLHCHHSNEAFLAADKPPHRADGGEPVDSLNLSAPGLAEQNDLPDSLHEVMDNNAKGSNVQVEGVVLSIDDEFVIEDGEHDEMNVPKPTLAKLKRSRSCEESMHLNTKRPLRRKSFQENSLISPRSKLETIFEPKCAPSVKPSHEFGTTKFLEGLDLVDFLPSKLAQNEAQQRANVNRVSGKGGKATVLQQHESDGLSADFFELKSRYLSSCSAASPPASHERSSVTLRCSSDPAADDGMMMRSFALTHSRASSMDSAEKPEAVNYLRGRKQVNGFHTRHPISAVEEEDEEDCGSDDSETFEFKQAVSVYSQEDMRGSHVQSQKQVHLRKPTMEEREEAKEKESAGKFKELCVVSTGDAVLFTGSNSEEFDLIPSKSYLRSSSGKAGNPCSALAATNHNNYHNQVKKLEEEEEQQQQQSSLCVDDIIYLLERDELDEEVLLSFLNVARSTSGGGNTSCPASDVASEASFEFKVKSAGSTPHSTPSTPMLSAGSTPKRITQLSPLALTPEEIAEIWGVFEQRQALAPYQT